MCRAVLHATKGYLKISEMTEEGTQRWNDKGELKPKSQRGTSILAKARTCQTKLRYHYRRHERVGSAMDSADKAQP